MVTVRSIMMPLGSNAPDFALPNTAGQTVSPADFADRNALLVMFISNHCPYVKHIRAQLAQLGRDYQAKGVGIVAIMSNDVDNHPDDSPEKMKQEVEDAGYTFDYLYDADQSVALAYRAACTPDFFLFDGDMKLAYRGQLDDSRPKNDLPVTGADLRGALDAILAGKSASAQQIPSMGCNIKWKPGHEPDYFNSSV